MFTATIIAISLLAIAFYAIEKIDSVVEYFLERGSEE